MANAYAEAKRLPLGLGDLYINKIWVGNLKGKVTFHDKVSYAEQFPGNSLSPLKAERIKQEVTLEAEICDFKISQLRRALGINEAVNSSSVALRMRDNLVIPTTTSSVSTSHTMVGGTLKVSKMDRSTVYVSGTDYTVPTATQTIKRKAGAIALSQVVIVEYNFSDSSAKSVIVGGEQLTPNLFDLQFVHALSDTKILQIEMFNCYSMTDFSWVFHEKSSGNFSMYSVTFKALIDLTKKEGQNLYQITEETGSATVN